MNNKRDDSVLVRQQQCTEYITLSALKNLFPNGDEMPKLSLSPRSPADKPFVSIIIHEHGPVDCSNCITMSLLFNTSVSTKHLCSVILSDGEMGRANNNTNSNMHCALGGCGKVLALQESSRLYSVIGERTLGLLRELLHSR